MLVAESGKTNPAVLFPLGERVNFDQTGKIHRCTIQTGKGREREMNSWSRESGHMSLCYYVVAAGFTGGEFVCEAVNGEH